MRIDHFKDWEKEIQSYCDRMNFDFEKLKKLSKGNGLDFLIFVFVDTEKKMNGLMEDTPSPVILIVKKKKDEILFETTEYTDLYLKKIS